MKNGQKRIVIASLLKPVDDTRMYEKMAVSLVASGDFEVHIIGYPAKGGESHPHVHFIPLRPFKRISVGRLFAPVLILKNILQVKPEALIINTHELLIVALVNRILFGTKIIYDIRENYYRNLLYTAAFPPVLKNLLALWVRAKEKLSAPAFDHFFLAEKGYEKEMNFFRKKYTVIENKAVLLPGFSRMSTRSSKTNLLFSGTLAETTGVFNAIDLTKALFEIDPHITLKIVGYCAQPHTLSKIRHAIQGLHYIQLVGGDHLVPHHQIMQAIGEADFGIICYTPSLHTQNSIPTKLYEYLACRLPILLQNHRPWIEICLPFQAAVAVDFEKLQASEIHQMMAGKFYSSPPENVLWQSEAEKLIEALEQILSSRP